MVHRIEFNDAEWELLGERAYNARMSITAYVHMIIFKDLATTKANLNSKNSRGSSKQENPPPSKQKTVLKTASGKSIEVDMEYEEEDDDEEDHEGMVEFINAGSTKYPNWIDEDSFFRQHEEQMSEKGIQRLWNNYPPHMRKWDYPQ